MKNKIWIYPIIITGFALILNIGCRKNDSDIVIPTVYTTLDRTIVPDIVPAIPTVKIDDPANFAKYGYGSYHFGPGLSCQKRLDLMPSGYGNTLVTKEAKLLRFFTMTDIHLTDKESPCQAIFFAPFAGENGISCYSPLMLYTTHVLDAAVQTINELHKTNPFDLGLALGDLANCTQYNELRWFIDIMDGQPIKPYSGGVKDPVSGFNNDYQDEYKATGLNSSIPWYVTIGNHDHFWLGSKNVNDKLRNAFIGGNILLLGNIFKDPDAMDKSTFSMGTLDGSTAYGAIIGSGVVAEMGTIPTITPDPDRRSLSVTDWINEFNNTSSFPKGHGFNQDNPLNRFGSSYSFEPKSDLPLKIIMLDDTQDQNDPLPADLIYGYGELNNGRYEWLMAQLQAGQEENKLMIIATHVPIGVAPGTPVGWLPGNAGTYTTENDLISQLRAFPNLILYVAGHRHVNNVTAFPSTDINYPENSFWEVETKSLREFPEQFRTFDIVRNSDNNISIITTDVDPEMKEASMAAIGRSYAIASYQIYGLSGPELPTGSVSYNAELVKQLSPAMQVIISKKGTPIE
jgi:metallophosphoesterase (TIGR03768 family)